MVPFTCRLRRLALHNVVLESDKLLRLLRPFRDSLIELEVERTSLSTYETFESILDAVGSTLERLVIRDCDVRLHVLPPRHRYLITLLTHSFWADWTIRRFISSTRSYVVALGSASSRSCALTLRHPHSRSRTIVSSIYGSGAPPSRSRRSVPYYRGELLGIIPFPLTPPFVFGTPSWCLGNLRSDEGHATETESVGCEGPASMGQGRTGSTVVGL
jgi:hypothetical protein